MVILRLILFPFTLVYAFIILIRNALYKLGIFTRTQFDFPIICVGNIAVGGTGKTPHIEWIIRALQSEFQLAILSRGYKRKTSGYILADKDSTASEIGDEPLQLFQKFPKIQLAVSENRVLGVPALLGDKPEVDVILMDDGFQHLPIKPSYAIVLTDYHNLFYNDWLLPSGTLREFPSAYKRAQCILVTKCPTAISESDKQQIIKRINPLPNQLVQFSSLTYGALQPVFEQTISISTQTAVLAFSGIANNDLFTNELKQTFTFVNTVSFRDHKEYTRNVLTDIVQRFKAIDAPNKILVTTEKDAVKLHSIEAKKILGHLPVYCLPIEVLFEKQAGEQILQKLRAHILQIQSEA